VLRGRTTLRTGDGSRELAEGEAVHFPRGPGGAHGLANETDEPVRVLMASSRQRSSSIPTSSSSPPSANGLADRRPALANPRCRVARLLTQSFSRCRGTVRLRRAGPHAQVCRTHSSMQDLTPISLHLVPCRWLAGLKMANWPKGLLSKCLSAYKLSEPQRLAVDQSSKGGRSCEH
jgi:Cupin domain